MSVVINGSTGIETPGLTNSGNTTLGDASTDTLNVGNGGLIKDASGNIGVGVTPSAATARTLQGPANFTFGSQGNGVNLASNAVDNSGWKYATTAPASLYQHIGGVHYWYTAASGTAGNAISWTTAMTLSANGNLQVPAIYNNTTANAANVWVDSNGIPQRSTSALKYKQDVRDLESVDLSKFRPVRYKSKCANDDQTKDHIGFIADEYVDSQPELVTFGADGEVEGFAYERMTAVLCKAIQELKAEFDAYKAAHP